MQPPKGLIFDIQRFSLHNGPGIRTTVFLKGCPLRCWWCHNPESQGVGRELMVWSSRCIRCGECAAACPEQAIALDGGTPITDLTRCTVCGTCADVCHAQAREIVGREMAVDEIMAEVERDVAFYDQSGGGATFSGGEPLIQRGFLSALLQACKQREIHTALDTCGFAPWAALDSVRQYVDLFLYDLKVVDDTRHRQLTGVSNRGILRNVRALSERGHHIILRVPVIPGMNDDEDNLRQTAAFAAGLPQLDRIDLLPYHHAAADKCQRVNRTYGLPNVRPPSDERMEEIARAVRSLGLNVQAGG